MSTSFDVVPITIYGNTVIGVYIFTNNKYTLVPLEVPEKIINVVENILKTEVVRVSIAKSPLIGIFITGNDNGVLLPNIVTSDELSILKKLDLNVEILETKYTAISNLILTNNEKTIVSPLLEKESIKKIQDTLNTEVIVDTLCNTYLVGSIAVANSRGVLLSPEATNQDIEKIKKIFNTSKVDVGTVNRGRSMIRSGLVVNDNGGLVGSDTTGFEIVRIVQVLGKT